MVPIPAPLGLAAIALVFSAFAVRSVRQFRRARETWKWDRMPGQITWSMIDEVVTQRGRRLDYIPQIRFRYRVGKREYESNHLFRGNFSQSSEAAARKWTSQFPPGKEVHVYVNPEDFAEAVLVRGDPTALDRFIILGLAFVVLGAMAAALLV